jgi:hypothetical protein
MGEMSVMLKERVENIAKDLVDNPDAVEVNASVSTKAVIIQVRVEQSDCGKIIGKRGKTIEAIKTICLAAKNTKFPDDSRRVIIEVLEDENTGFKYNK